MSAPIRLSVLDQSPVIYGHSARDAIAATVDLAQLTDSLGYTRYWCAEHHGLRGVSNPAPEVMIARVASATQHLRVGSGGVMLPYYSPFKLAEQFRLLEALFPNRIDLGVGRAPGGDMRTAAAVAMGDYNRGDIFPQQVQELIWHLTGTLPSDHPAYGVLLQPEIDTKPELWMLGSSDFGGALAARLGIRFAFAHFINPHVSHIVAQQYRTDFEPGYDARPYSAAAIFVIAADTEAEARRYEAAVDLRRVQMALGANGPIPTVEQGEAHVYTERDQAIVMRERPRSIIGTPESIADQMHALKDRFVADELIVLTVAPSYKARLRSYELLAEAFALPSPASVTSANPSSACPA